MRQETSVIRRGLTGSISVAAMACALVLASPALAQSSTAALEGHVDGVPAGTVVTATDTHTGQTVTGKVNANGDYSILGLRPSDYEVQVQGKPAQTATLLVGQTVAVDFVDTANAIVVTGHRNLQVFPTQTLSTNVTTEQIENLPQNSRNFLSFASLAPGIQLSSPSGASQVQAGAVSPDQTNVFIDGLSTKNLTNHGGTFGQNFGQGGNPFPQIAIQEYSIETQNFGAETGDAGSAVINAITKTGGNKFHGSAFLEYQPGSFIEQPHFATGPKGKYTRYQFGAELGGPIIPDKLTFYIAGEGVSENLPSNTGQLPVTNPPPATDPYAYGYPANVASAINGVVHPFNFHQGLYFGKLTYYANNADTINLSAYIRRETNLSDIDGNATESHARNLQTDVTKYQFNWQHHAGNFVNSLNLAYSNSHQSTPSVGTGPEYNLTNRNLGTNNDFNAGQGAELGAHFFEQGDYQKTWTIKNDSTLISGDHTIKFGARVAFNDLARTVSNAYNGRYFFENPGSGVANFDPTTAIPYGAIINIQPSDTLAAKDTQIGAYVQDEWKPDEHWTFNYGLRWDMETNAHNNNYVTPASVVTALANYQPWQAAGIDYRDYVSTGSERKIEWAQFQPRLGFSYDVYGDHDLIIFGGAGRYYDRSLFLEGVIESITNSSIIPKICFNSSVNTCATGVAQLTWNEAYRDPAALRAAAEPLGNAGGTIDVLKNDMPAPFSDQFDLGVRKRIGSVNFSATLSYVRSHNIFAFVRGNRMPDGSYSAQGPGYIQDNFPADGQPAPYSRVEIGDSSGKANLFALYLQVEKPFTKTSKWGLTSSLTFQRARTNYAGPSLYNNDTNYNEAEIGAYGWGNVSGVPWYMWNTSVNYRAPADFILSGTLNLNSGPAFGHIIFGQNPDGSPSPAGTTYANFNGVYYPRNVFAYKRLDLRIAKSFTMPWAGDHKLTVDFEVFNVFNWLNRNYSAWGAGSGLAPPGVLDGDGQVGNDQRQFQAGIKYKF